MIQIKPYISVDSLRFGEGTVQQCREIYGEPQSVGRNSEGVEEHEYDGFILRFDPDQGVLRELTLLPKTAAVVDGIEVTWDRTFFCAACRRDGAPLDLYGFIVFLKLGITVTGIHDDDSSQLAVSAFTRGEFDDLLDKSVPFDFADFCGGT